MALLAQLTRCVLSRSRRFLHLLIKIFEDGQTWFGPHEWSPDIIKRLEEACNIEILASGFSNEMTDDELEESSLRSFQKLEPLVEWQCVNWQLPCFIRPVNRGTKAEHCQNI